MKNINKIISSLFISSLVFSSFSYAVMLPAPKESQTPYGDNNVLRAVTGTGNDCLPCRANFLAGANKADINLINEHLTEVFGQDFDKADSGAVDGFESD